MPTKYVKKGRIYHRVGEMVEYNGVRFYRYPNSNRRAHRDYFSPGIQAKQNGVDLLHRQVWKDHFGDIPDGYQIHHKDENTLNNDLSNLECVTAKQHLHKHPARLARCRSEEQMVHLESIREKTKAWHGSEEGLEWHIQHAKNIGFGQHKLVDVECAICGKSFQTKRKAERNYCSKECNQANQSLLWHSGKKFIHAHECQCCGKQFKSDRVVSMYCSKSCARRKTRTNPQESLQLTH